MATSAPQTLLDYWRSTATSIDCDTLDVSVAADLGPFVDCTSNQAIAALELARHEHRELVLKAARLARGLKEKGEWGDVPVEKLGGEIATVLLAHTMLPHLTHRVHLQTDPAAAHSTSATTTSALRLVSLFHSLSPIQPAPPSIAIDRLCLKIPSTHAGLLAAHHLHQPPHNLTTLATTLFALPQAALAARVRCAYVAPYVNSLQLHFEPGFAGSAQAARERALAMQEVRRALAYYDAVGARGKPAVLPASLGSVGECTALVRLGVEHLTVAPGLLREAAATPYQPGDEEAATSDADGVNGVSDSWEKPLDYLDDKEGFERDFAAANGGREKEKLDHSIRVFVEFQDQLEARIKKALEEVA
ncbi:transaldolase [Phyllosticta citribraziliensis]|uniref:Transaldolase n=1 Tax=Phyllosticta citribraziliensis TaxID=989973 RepID=A0ABR1LW00_9PEZI